MNAAGIFVVVELKRRLVKTSNVPMLFRRDTRTASNIYKKKYRLYSVPNDRSTDRVCILVTLECTSGGKTSSSKYLVNVI